MSELALEEPRRIGQLGLHAPRVLRVGLAGQAAQVAVRLGVRLHVNALGDEGLQLIPGERVAAGADVVGVDEQRGREAQLLQHGIGVVAERVVAVVERQHDGFPRQLPLEPQPLDEVRQRHHAVAFALEVAHLLGEGAAAEREAALRLRAEVVVDEDRHELIAGRLHARRVPRPPGDDHAMAGREGARAAVEVLDHPGLGRVGQIGSRQRSRRLVPDGDGDDEVLRLADDGGRRPVGCAAGRGDRGAAAEHQQRGAEAQRAHRPRTS